MKNKKRKKTKRWYKNNFSYCNLVSVSDRYPQEIDSVVLLNDTEPIKGAIELVAVDPNGRELPIQKDDRGIPVGWMITIPPERPYEFYVYYNKAQPIKKRKENN